MRAGNRPGLHLADSIPPEAPTVAVSRNRLHVSAGAGKSVRCIQSGRTCRRDDLARPPIRPLDTRLAFAADQFWTSIARPIGDRQAIDQAGNASPVSSGRNRSPRAFYDCRHATDMVLGLLAPALLGAQTGPNVDWPLFGGTTDNTHYSTLGQITPANVATLQVAWTYATRDEFKGSEMQTNPVVIDGVLYGTSPKLRVFALDATTGAELGASIRRVDGRRRSASVTVDSS